MGMSAARLIDEAITCVICGKIHEPRKLITGIGFTWAGKDGHSYRTRILDMTGRFDGSMIEALRRIAGGA